MNPILKRAVQVAAAERREAAKRMKASLGAGQRIVNGNLRRQGSYSPKRFQFTP
jgi:hypothetical protein